MLTDFYRSKRLGDAIKLSMQLLALNLIFVFVNRLVETVLLLSTHHLPAMFADSLAGLFFDVALIALVSVALFIIIYLLLAFGKKAAILTTVILSFILHLAHLPLAYFYVATLTPLDRLLFAHSMQELTTTVSTAGVNFFLVFILLIIYAVVYGLTAWWMFSIKPPFVYRRNIIAVTLIFAVLAVVVKPVHLKLPTYHSKNIISNKSLLFYKDALAHLSVRLFYRAPHRDVQANARRYQALFTHQDYLSYDHAFLNKRNKENPWGRFFPEKEMMPRVIMIVVEGLNNDFLLPDDGVMLMPFLDSLKNESLYWDHFIGTGERSFAVLPSMIGSMPHGDIGFTMLNDMPLHLTLINKLRPAGYHSAFYYGQGGYFHEKEAYLLRNFIDRFIDKNDYDDDFNKIYDPHSDYHWGYHDQDLVRNYFRITDQDEGLGCSRFEIIFTGTMHSPFIIDNEEYYDKKYQDIIDEAAVSAARRAYYRNYQPYLRTLLFADDALRLFFEELAERPCYDESIVIITGDHPMTEVPIAGLLKKYHVPLIVYSPMLTEARTISNLAGQFDVTPALVNLLEQNFGLPFGDYSHMFGLPADTSTSLRSDALIPLMRGNRQIDELVYNNYFLSVGDLYEIRPGLETRPVQNREMRAHMIDMLEAYNLVNDDVIRTVSLLPDSIFFDHTGFQPAIDTVFSRGLLVEPELEYIDISTSTAMLSPGQPVYLHVRGEFYPRRSGEMPMIVYDIRDRDDNSVYWEAFGLTSGQKNRRFRALPHVSHFSTIVPEIDAADEYKIYIYLWNQDEADIRFDHLEVKSFYAPKDD